MSYWVLVLGSLAIASAQDADDEAPPDATPDAEASDKADEAEDTDSAEVAPLSPEEMATAEPAPIFVEDALAAPLVDAERLDYLRPERGELPQEPYAWTPWSAYSLEWGEARVGLSEAAIGIVPRVQLGTSLPLDALGVPNAQLKANAVRLGPIDLAAVASYHAMPGEEFSGSWLQAGGQLSLRVADPVTWHVGARWGHLQAQGLPELGAAANALTGGSADDLEEWTAEAREQGIELALDRQTLTAETAIDWRFSRRDSLVLRGKATPWASGARTTEGIPEDATDEEAEEAEETIDGLPPILLLDEMLETGDTLGDRLASTYVASLAYQASFKNATLRIGFGVSAVKYAWLLQTTELSFHFGGKSRASERRMNRSWKNNKKDLNQGEAPDAIK
jgi:hypothetical protein